MIYTPDTFASLCVGGYEKTNVLRTFLQKNDVLRTFL